MTEQRLNKLMAKDLANEISAEEKAELENWLMSSEENTELYRKVKQGWYEARIEMPGSGSDAVFDKVLDQINHKTGKQEDRKVKASGSHRKSRIKKLSFYLTAAVVVFTVGLGLLYHFRQSNKALPSVRGSELITKETPRGKKLKVFLSDGSTVWLNSESRISYYQEFSGRERRLTLTGEAYFEIAKDKDRPFLVEAGAITTEVVGTSFNVRAFENESTVEVDLSSGEVLVSIRNNHQSIKEKPIVLAPGESITYNKSDRSTSKTLFDVAIKTGWKDGLLIFSQADFESVKSRLERWYGVHIEHTGKLPDWNLDAKFDNASLEIVLNSLAHSENFQYEMKNDKVKIKLK